MGEVILVASGKGGVGKSVFSTNIGAILAERGAKVVLVDMNMGLRNLDLYLGLENNVVYDVADVLSGMCRIKKALIRDRRFPEYYLMSAAQYKDTGYLTDAHMKVLCKKLKDNFDYIIIDGPAGVGENMKLAAAGAERAVVVTVPEYVALRDADMMDHTLEAFGIRNRCYVVNMVRPELFEQGWGPTLPQIAESMHIPLVGIIPEDENIRIAANNGFPIVCRRGTYIRSNFEAITDRLFG